MDSELSRVFTHQRSLFVASFVNTNSAYLILKSWAVFHALIAAKRSVKSGKNSWNKRRLNVTNFSSASNRISLSRLSKICLMNNLIITRYHFHHLVSCPMISSSSSMRSIVSSITPLTINSSSSTMEASPLKVAGDQHRTHLKLMEEPLTKALTTHTSKSKLISRPKKWPLITWNKSSEEIILMKL